MVKMTYYYLKQKVSLGDIIDFKGLKVEVTDNLIKSNPDLFVVEKEYPEYVKCIKTVSSNYTLGKIYKIINYDYYPKQLSIIGNKGRRNDIYCWTEEYLKNSHNCFKPSTPEAFQIQELLEEAKRKYPVGTRFKSAYNNDCEGEVSTTNFYWWFDSDIVVDVRAGKSVYRNGKWAEIIKPIFKTEDGVDIYEGDTVYYVRKDSENLPNEVMEHRNYCGLHSDLNIYFSTKEAAEDWLAKNKPKDLQYYEDLLLTKSGYYKPSIISSADNIPKKCFYKILKQEEPKLYWLKVLELVQQDLDDGWKADWNDPTTYKYRIEKHYTEKYNVESYRTWNSGLCNFKSEESAQKAIELMGDKLDAIFL